jgi:predicted metalloprotease
MSVGFIPERFKLGRHLKGRWGHTASGALSPEGSVEQWERWDGSVDCNVNLRPFRIRVRAEQMNRPKVQALMLELEQAIRLNEAGKTDPRVHAKTARIVNEVKERLWKELN